MNQTQDKDGSSKQKSNRKLSYDQILIRNVIICVVIGLAISLVILSTFIIPYTYSSNTYSIKADTVIRHLYINGQDVCAHYQVFQTEEDYQLKWQLETPVRRATSGNDTLFTYSSLQTYDDYKTFIFRPDGFTVEIKKCYTKTGFCDNNQILVDVNNQGFHGNATSFIFLGKNWNMTIDVLSSNPPLTIQPPPPNGTELQLNFNNMSDRDTAFHTEGNIETVLFNVTISKG